MQDLITVIIPIYNVEEYLDECINSVLKQSYTNLDVILADDGSTDKSGVIADDYAKKDKRCRVYHRKNQGVSATRNFGITVAKGKYIVFLDSDDMLDEHMIERLYQEALKEQVDMVLCGIKRKTPDKEYVKAYQVPSRIYQLQDYMYEMYDREHGSEDVDMFLPMVAAWNKIYKKSLFDHIRYPEGRIHEDCAVIHRLVAAAGNVKWLNEPLYIYRERKGSIMQQDFSSNRMDDFYGKLDCVRFMNERTEDKKLMNLLVSECMNVGRRYWCRIKNIKGMDKEKTEQIFEEIKEAYRQYVRKDTFMLSQKMLWFFFLHMRTLYMALYTLVHKVKNS